ncbi:MAG: Excinuclease ABC subunit A [Candidatus Kapaibacterium sp.]|nr:MAG: Excinuclease ABC subunit A [Candidatus Kapabacteria bacterium]
MGNKKSTMSLNGEEYIRVRGAREHNLKNINVEIPRNKFVVITGLSGSGKSTLAFDTIYSEGHRRYVDCLSAYSRQFIGNYKKPEVDFIEGISPSISIEQKTISPNPRSTVGTVTEIYDYLRLLFAKIGVQYCPDCKIPVEKKNISQIIKEILEKFSERKVQILAPVVRGRKGHYRELFEQFLRLGFTQVRVDGEFLEIVEDMKVSRYQTHNIELVVDKLIVNPSHEQRLYQSCDLALNYGEGNLIVYDVEDEKEFLYSIHYSCPKCGRSFEPLVPNSFSYNSRYGACPKCDGIGELFDFDLDLLIPDKNLSISEGAIEILKDNRFYWLLEQVVAFAQKFKYDLERPIKDFQENELNFLLYGDPEDPIEITMKMKHSSSPYRITYNGVVNALRQVYKNSDTPTIVRTLEKYIRGFPCPVCNGARLKEESLNVFVYGYSIYDISKSDITSAKKILAEIHSKLNERERQIARLIFKELFDRLEFLEKLGIAYVSIDRSVRTLSGGESQRIRLAAQLGSELVGVTYVLDEPSIGLHQYDNHKLIDSLKKLRDLGNTVIVVEHDKATIESSDYIIDLGPKAGIQGGEVIFSASPEELKKLDKKIKNKSLTAQYLLNDRKIELPKERRKGNGKAIILRGAKGNNLKNVTLRLPLGLFVCITGLSGSGKSSLINDTLYPILSNHFYNSNLKPLPYDSIEGIEFIDKIIEIDQSPIGRTPRSNPATYTGVFTEIRNFFAMLPESRLRGYKAGRFSFNIPGGRCEDCQGGGMKVIEMNFLPEVYVVCDTCGGKRYNDETLAVKYKGKSIADVLEMTVEESLEFFKDIPKIKKVLQTLYDVGLGYIKLGQQAPTLSGGEAQRVKLATELSKRSTGKTLYLLDEPTTGLHFEDIRLLLKLLNELVDKGNTVVVIEHNLDVIKCADWIIDLGPKGGDEGGEIVAEGTPEDVARNPKSLTGLFLKEELGID